MYQPESIAAATCTFVGDPGFRSVVESETVHLTGFSATAGLSRPQPIASPATRAASDRADCLIGSNIAACGCWSRDIIAGVARPSAEQPVAAFVRETRKVSS